MNSDLKYWIETSDTLGRFFLQQGAHPLLNTMAAVLLGVDGDSVVPSGKDAVHYQRSIHGSMCDKIILAMEDESVFQAGLETIGRNYLFIPWAIAAFDQSNPYGLLYSLEQAVAITENIYRENEENSVDEMPPAWGEALRDCLKTFNAYRKKRPKIDYTEDYIEYCEFLFVAMPPLKLHEIKKQ